MKAVLISIQPKWVELIASGKKTIEVRKTVPKLERPFKCYIYCTNNRNQAFYFEKKACNGLMAITGSGKGKVIGEFVCDMIDTMPIYIEASGYDEYLIENNYLDKCCLTYDEITTYGKGKTLYGWHISDIKIYDKPKELSEFKVECPTTNKINGDCNFCKYTTFSFYGRKPECKAYLTRPPQSWCYVEVE